MVVSFLWPLTHMICRALKSYPSWILTEVALIEYQVYYLDRWASFESTSSWQECSCLHNTSIFLEALKRGFTGRVLLGQRTALDIVYVHVLPARVHVPIASRTSSVDSEILSQVTPMHIHQTGTTQVIDKPLLPLISSTSSVSLFSLLFLISSSLT